jgi:hypothetical protein
LDKKILYAIIGLATIAGTFIALPTLAQILQSVTNNHTGTINNPHTLFNAFYDGINRTDASQVDWGTFEVGENSLELNVTNISNQRIKIIVYVYDLDPSFNVYWGLNNSAINEYGTLPYTAVADFIVTIPDTAIDGSTLDFNVEVTATPV